VVIPHCACSVEQTPGIRILGKMHCGSFIMIEFAKTWAALKLDRRAVTALEYGLIAGVIVAVITLGFTSLAGALSTKFVGIGTSL
jgi:Flp pilus assembly pilin Flp